MAGESNSHAYRNILAIGIILGAVATACATSVPCDLRETKYGAVCVCNENYCDYLDDPSPKTAGELVVVTSSKAGLRFHTTEGKFNVFQKLHILDHQRVQLEESDEEDYQQAPVVEERAGNMRSVRLDINRERQHQKIVGFGGSFTGAVSYLLEHLPQGLQDHLYESFYSAERGIGFNLMRMSIGGCDFDLAPWAYNETPENVTELDDFKIDERDAKKVEQIKRLQEVSKVPNLRIKGAAWSSPRWMKTNNKWTGYSRLKKEYYQTWADYHVKWLEMMEANGLPIWAISTGNEPTNGVAFMFFVKFMSLGWTPQKQAVWLAEHLGPTLRKSKYKDIIIFGNDDQRYTFAKWFTMMNATRPNSIDYLDGFAVHWYWDEIFKPVFIEMAHSKMPEKILLSTEACIGDKPWQKAKPLLGSWTRGEKYARSFLQDLQHSFNGWIDWNLILDEKGGPNYVDNTVDAPIVVNMTNTNEFFKQPMFYTMGHFSKFIPEGSIRIDSVRSNINVDTVSFLKPDGDISTVVFNSGNANVEVNIVDSVRGGIVVNIPPKSINTILYK